MLGASRLALVGVFVGHCRAPGASFNGLGAGSLGALGAKDGCRV